MKQLDAIKIYLFVILSLLARSFILPFFRIWYLPFFFGYALIPQQKRDMEVTIIWLIFMAAMLSFSGISFDPLRVLDSWKRVPGL